MRVSKWFALCNEWFGELIFLEFLPIIRRQRSPILEKCFRFTKCTCNRVSKLDLVQLSPFFRKLFRAIRKLQITLCSNLVAFLNPAGHSWLPTTYLFLYRFLPKNWPFLYLVNKSWTWKINSSTISRKKLEIWRLMESKIGVSNKHETREMTKKKTKHKIFKANNFFFCENLYKNEMCQFSIVIQLKMFLTLKKIFARANFKTTWKMPKQSV